jgi:signal transduction histidine kinase
MFQTFYAGKAIPNLSHYTPIRRLVAIAIACVIAFVSVSIAANGTLSSIQHIQQAKISSITPFAESTAGPLTKLPHSWNNDRPQRHGAFNYVTPVEFSIQQFNTPIAIYLPRLGNRYEVWINERLIHSSGDLSNTQEAFTHSPLFVELPKALINVGMNTLRLKVVGEPGRFAGVSSIYVGDAIILKKEYDSRVFFHSFSTLAIVISCVLIGVLALVFSYFLRNRHYLIFGLSATFWAFSHSYLLIHQLPIDYRIGLFFYDFFYATGVAFLLLSITYVIRLRRRWYVQIVYFFIASSLFLTLAHHSGYPLARSIFLNAMLALALLTFALYLRSFFKNQRSKSWVMFVMLAVSLSFGVYDQLIVYQYKNGFEILTLSRYAFLLCTLAVAVMLASQVVRISIFIKQSHRRTLRKLTENQKKLETVFSSELKAQSELVVEKERWRMMQDMHDGLGSQLIGLQHAVKDPNANPQMLDSMVRNSIAELRMNINSLGHQHKEISTMLGALRERLELMIEPQGKKLVWAVGFVPELDSIDHTVIEHLEKMILEVFANIAKHSSALTVRLSAQHFENSHVCIHIKEDGGGYDRQSCSEVVGKGLAGLNKRAQLFGAQLSIDAKGCDITITIPIPAGAK